MMRPSTGRLIQAVAVGHGAIGAVLYREELAQLARDGVLNTVPERGDRAAAFWFMTAAPALWAVGRLVHSAERNDDAAAQRATGAVLAGVGAVGTAAMPKGGFPALLGIGGLLLRRARRG
ncbi:DUF6463 family protein [Streptomyces sp. 891-h]|uniref:DUF6463 family protein n=1 Tax=unclassified Streptomyces TaxID=2593676 RepID=UPI001FAAF6ED|nr:DUF6463 family protein [Streptomyces sp. 891-h]UNZ19819.1 hypothetical protein HC362_25055 [Streptomyces sp. 891-h]